VAWRDRTFVRDGAHVTVSGRLDAARAGALVDALFASMPARSDRPAIPAIAAKPAGASAIRLSASAGSRPALALGGVIGRAEQGLARIETLILAHAFSRVGPVVARQNRIAALKDRLRSDWTAGGAIVQGSVGGVFLVSGTVDRQGLAALVPAAVEAWRRFGSDGRTAAERASSVEILSAQRRQAASNAAVHAAHINELQRFGLTVVEIGTLEAGSSAQGLAAGQALRVFSASPAVIIAD
jgi:hypothetical protein